MSDWQCRCNAGSVNALMPIRLVQALNGAALNGADLSH